MRFDGGDGVTDVGVARGPAGPAPACYIIPPLAEQGGCLRRVGFPCSRKKKQHHAPYRDISGSSRTESPGGVSLLCGRYPCSQRPAGGPLQQGQSLLAATITERLDTGQLRSQQVAVYTTSYTVTCSREDALYSKLGA